MTDESEIPPEVEVPAAPSECATCGAQLEGPYCASCGERALREDEYSLRRMITDAFQSVFSFDANVLRSLWSLVARPGELTREYMAGRRGRWTNPVQLFLTVNLIYFVVQPLTGFSGYNTPLVSHMNRQVYSDNLGIGARVREDIRDRVQPAVAADLEAARERGESPTEADSVAVLQERYDVELTVYETRFDARGEVYARALVAVLIPMLTVVLVLLFAFRGVPLAQHVVFATHVMAWVLFFMLSIFPFIQRPLVAGGTALAGLLLGMSGGEVAATELGATVRYFALEFGSLAVEVPYVYLAMRAVYEGRWWGLVPKTLIAVATLVFSTFAYRLLLFWVTYLSV